MAPVPALSLIASSARPRRVPWAAALLAILALVVGVVGWVVWETTAPGRSLRALPRAERQVVYQRTMDDLKTLCGPQRPVALREHCRELAELVAPLKECGPECEAVIRPILTPVPTR
jgi:hypothetical protein